MLACNFARAIFRGVINHYHLVSGAQRLKRATDESRQIHRERIAAYEAELRSRGAEVPERSDWRQYPRTLQFGYRANSNGVQPVDPPKRGRKQKDHSPPATPPDQPMAALEQSIAAQVKSREPCCKRP